MLNFLDLFSHPEFISTEVPPKSGDKKVKQRKISLYVLTKQSQRTVGESKKDGPDPSFLYISFTRPILDCVNRF